ncbi:hypothetical protein NEMIN01_0938 [Nematocida minor]|uniref:uncharacterized protein n=1 Tax=Nematocida minor TaxID=1912983 RepID=UPI00221FDBBB|nr:uncharacterized protein NEMIN01_0938 [Nematocida minor]KAI5190239.1 hypothetical protein NEMIN01_0938 [Nematocida minor]
MKIFLFTVLLGVANCLRAPSTCAQPGQIALVFSDGPVQTTPELVQTLSDQGIPATFMFSTVNIDHSGVSDVIRQAVDEGNTVGLRTNPIYNFSDMEEEEIREAIVCELNVLDEVSGQKTKYISINQPDVMNSTVLKVIDELDLVLINYNYDMYGTDDDCDDMLNRWKLKLKSVRPQSTSYIVLQHDQRESELGMVPDVVNMGDAAGFKFVNIDDCLSGVSMDGPAPSGGSAASCSSEPSERTGTNKNSSMSPLILMGCVAGLLAL